jgi:hypothetical protein
MVVQALELHIRPSPSTRRNSTRLPVGARSESERGEGTLLGLNFSPFTIGVGLSVDERLTAAQHHAFPESVLSADGGRPRNITIGRLGFAVRYTNYIIRARMRTSSRLRTR